jgi:DNA polymerase-3 subunit delta'
MEVFGNKNVTEKVSLMLQNNKMAHAFLLYGDKGLGKKTLAKYIAMKILCKAENSPCGECFHCRNVLSNTHPDVFIVEHSGKTNSISAETVRKVCNEVSIKPNYDSKVFIFEDADIMNSTAQNILLKSIEEPPDYAYYVFTSKARDTFLPTILSRVVSMGVTECSEKECIQALQSMNYTQTQIDDALNCFHGNIGNCLDYLNEGELFKAVDIVKRFNVALVNRDEYELLKVFTDLNVKNKDTTKNILSIMDKHIRDVIAVKIGCNTPAGCYFEGAKQLASRLSIKACTNIHMLIYQAFYEIDSNVNMNLIVSSLCGNVIQNV